MENEIILNEGEILENAEQIKNDEMEQANNVDTSPSDTGYGYNGNGLSSGPESEELLQDNDEFTENGESDTVSEDFDISALVQSLLENQDNAENNEVVYTIWDKPFEEYSVTEGFLLFIFILLLWLVISRQIGGVFK